MITEVMKKRTRKRLDLCRHPKSVNLYRFIRLVLGPDISNRQIARRWGIHEKNFHEFRKGRYPVPRLEQLEKLARALGVNKHLVYEVAGGASARQVFCLVRKNNLNDQVKLLLTAIPSRGCNK